MENSQINSSSNNYTFDNSSFEVEHEFAGQKSEKDLISEIITSKIRESNY